MRDNDIGRDSTDHPGHSSEQLSNSEFFDALRQVVGFRTYSAVEDPLALIVGRIAKQPAVYESRLLLRILVAMVHARGEFRRAELAALDAPTLAMVIGLMDLRSAGTRPDRDWTEAVAAAEAASI